MSLYPEKKMGGAKSKQASSTHSFIPIYLSIYLRYAKEFSFLVFSFFWRERETVPHTYTHKRGPMSVFEKLLSSFYLIVKDEERRGGGGCWLFIQKVGRKRKHRC